MRCLLTHATYFKYNVRQKTSVGRPEEDITPKDNIGECLVVKCSISPSDNEQSLSDAVEEITEFSNDIDVNGVVIFPYAHLFEELRDPQEAIKFIDRFEEMLSDSFDSHIRVPFGWYKEYEYESTGHPLSASSRQY